MNKIFRSIAAAAAAAVVFAGCTIPGTNQKIGGNDNANSYSFSPTENTESEEVFSWMIQPSVQADNIISFDASRIDPDSQNNRSFINYSVIRLSGKYGLIDYAGNTIIRPEYDDYYVCRCGEIVLVKVLDERKQEYEYCTMDADRKLSETPAHTTDDSDVYYWDASTSKIFAGKKDSSTVTEYTGKRAVAVTEAVVELDDYGTLKATVPEGALCGLAKSGKLLADCQYDAYYAPTYKGIGSTLVAFRNASGKWGYLDADGNTVIDFVCDGDPNAYNGMINDDEMLIHPYLFCDEYVPVYKDGYYSYYDFSGEQVVRAGEFEQARPVNNGRAWVKQNGFWGVIQLGEYVEEERPKEEDSSSKADSSSSTATYWTTTAESSESEAAYTDVWTALTDENGNPVTSDTGAWTDTEVYTDYSSDTGAWTEPAYTEPAYTEPVYTDPVYTDPVVTEQPADFFAY